MNEQRGKDFPFALEHENGILPSKHYTYSANLNAHQ